MTALVRTELLKLLFTRATWGFVAGAFLLAVLRVELVIAGIDRAGASRRGSLELTQQVLGASGTGTILLLLLGVVMMTGELRHRTLTSTLIVSPDRGRLVMAKAIAASLTAAAVCVVLFAYAGVRGLLSGAVRFGDGGVVQLVVGGVVGAALWGWLGVAVGTLVRNQIAALLVPAVWIVGVETLLPSFGLAAVMPWTPGGATSALTGAHLSGGLPIWAAFLLLVAYCLAFAVPGTRRLVRSDVT
ncbi:ABC transporter permease [Geodermatophilus sp. SYSU D01176]